MCACTSMNTVVTYTAAVLPLHDMSSLQATARAECAAIEREFSEYRAAQRSTPEADLVRQLADAREQVRRTEAKAEKATAAKQSYKEQVSFCVCACVCLSVCVYVCLSDCMHWGSTHTTASCSLTEVYVSYCCSVPSQRLESHSWHVPSQHCGLSERVLGALSTGCCSPHY